MRYVKTAAVTLVFLAVLASVGYGVFWLLAPSPDAFAVWRAAGATYNPASEGKNPSLIVKGQLNPPLESLPPPGRDFDLTIHPAKGQLRAGLTRLGRLRSLMIVGATDEDLADIGGATQLVELDIGGEFTETGLVAIHRLANLKRLTVRGLRPSAESARELQRSLKECRIEYLP